MHVDPEVTDAYNTCISGHKWWVYLPKDLYEFADDWSCDDSCSDISNEINRPSFWFYNIMPQMRFE
jgi:hypothetical protein